LKMLWSCGNIHQGRTLSTKLYLRMCWLH
jgi:hypothetical protein